MAKGTFVGLDSATLAALKTQYVQCLAAIAVAGQSYTISGRQFNRAQLNEVKDTIAELQFAIDRANNNIRTMTVAGFGTPYSNS